ATFKVDVVQVDSPAPVRVGSQFDHAGVTRCGGRRLQLWQQQGRQPEVPEVVDAELQLETLGGRAGWREHHARVVDQDVDPWVPRGDRVGRGAHAIQTRQVHRYRVDVLGQLATVVRITHRRNDFR